MKNEKEKKKNDDVYIAELDAKETIIFLLIFFYSILQDFMY